MDKNSLRYGTFGVIAFMLLIGGAILVTKFTGFTVANSTPTASPARVAAVATPVIAPITATISRPSPTATSTIKVYIIGAVSNPGVYIMRPTDRIEDVITQAGGFTAEADQSRLNLAQRLQDEMQIVVPVRPTPGATPPPGGVSLPSDTANQGTPAKGKGATPTRTPGKMNINTASAADLESLPGIGEILAQRIVEYRTKNGPFKVLNDLKKVQGVNNSTLEKIKDQVIF